jgi:hypothetical protein
MDICVTFDSNIIKAGNLNASPKWCRFEKNVDVLIFEITHFEAISHIHD